LHEDQCPDQLALTEATHALLRVLWSGRWRSISPRYFVNAVWKHSALFAARKQQDANEFLNFYLGRVDDELKPRTATTSVMVSIEDTETCLSADICMIFELWSYANVSYSFVADSYPRWTCLESINTRRCVATSATLSQNEPNPYLVWSCHFPKNSQGRKATKYNYWIASNLCRVQVDLLGIINLIVTYVAKRRMLNGTSPCKDVHNRSLSPCEEHCGTKLKDCTRTIDE